MPVYNKRGERTKTNKKTQPMRDKKDKNKKANRRTTGRY